MRNNEDQLQIVCVNWFKYQYPNILIHHSPNGGSRSKSEGKRFKSMGVKAGWPDIHIPLVTQKHPGLFIELKFEDGKTRANQNEVHQFLAKQGYMVGVTNCIEGFIKIVNTYLKR
ncbi:VRR-NUC domain-containing protein [Aquirufa nivalisilvae]|uniref:VRR-NUC domain-containing protein n=1 Tax=Aquirufa TaxID=2676247 RepID=UPI00309F2C7C|nr:VRR-NUC domain-containing protein [Aquirufa nivalisilvae]